MRIPIKNVFNTASLETIKAYVLGRHQRQWYQKKAEAESSVDPNYTYHFNTDGKNFGIIMEAKHDKALQINPVGALLNLDNKQAAKMEKVFDTGKPGTITGSARFEGLPEWMIDNATTDFEIHIKPLVPDLKLYVSIQCFDPHGNVLLDSKFVELKLVEPYGRKYQRWQGVSSNQPSTYTIEHDNTKSNHRSSFNLSFVFSDNPVEVARYLDALAALENTDYIEITNLPTAQVSTHPSIGGFRSTNYDEPLHRLAKALSVLAAKANLLIPIPEKYTLGDVRTAEIVAEILNTGKSYKVTLLPKELQNQEGMLILGGNVERKFVDDLEQEFQRDGFGFIQLPGGWDVQIFGTKVELGKSEYWAYSPKILDEKDTEHFATSNNVPKREDLIPFAAEIDYGKSFMRFLEWDIEAK